MEKVPQPEGAIFVLTIPRSPKGKEEVENRSHWPKTPGIAEITCLRLWIRTVEDYSRRILDTERRGKGYVDDVVKVLRYASSISDIDPGFKEILDGCLGMLDQNFESQSNWAENLIKIVRMPIQWLMTEGIYKPSITLSLKAAVEERENAFATSAVEAYEAAMKAAGHRD